MKCGLCGSTAVDHQERECLRNRGLKPVKVKDGSTGVANPISPDDELKSTSSVVSPKSQDQLDREEQQKVRDLQ